MAFAVACKRAPLAGAGAGLLKKLLLSAPSASAGPAPAAAAAALRPACVVASRHLFSFSSTSGCGAPFCRDDDFDSESEEEYSYSGGDDDDDDEEVVNDRPRSSMFFFTDVEPMSLGRRRLQALMEEEAPRQRGWWVSKEDVNAVKLKVAMPGLGKEHVKVWADQDGLVIEGEGDKDAEYDDDDEAPAKYRHRVELPADEFKMDQIKAEMKDGVLRVSVPKMKLEERKDVFRVKVE